MKQFKFEIIITCSEDSIEVVEDILKDALIWGFEGEEADIQISPAGILINDG